MLTTIERHRHKSKYGGHDVVVHAVKSTGQVERRLAALDKDVLSERDRDIYDEMLAGTYEFPVAEDYTHGDHDEWLNAMATVAFYDDYLKGEAVQGKSWLDYIDSICDKDYRVLFTWIARNRIASADNEDDEEGETSGFRVCTGYAKLEKWDEDVVMRIVEETSAEMAEPPF
jgi:hypothetical protein